MALTPILQITSVAPSGENSVTHVSDDTVYGGVNPARNTLAVYLLANKVTEGTTLQETPLVVQTYDPLTVEDWIVENTIDGYQKYILLIFPIYNPAGTYTQYQTVFYNGSLYQSVSAAPLQGVTPGEDSSWEIRTPQQIYAVMDTATEPPNLTIVILGYVLTYAAQKCLGLLAPKHAKANCAGCAGNPALKEKFDDLWLLVFNANIASTRQKFIEGERFMRSAELYCTCDA